MTNATGPQPRAPQRPRLRPTRSPIAPATTEIDELIMNGVELRATELTVTDSDFAEVTGCRFDDVRLAGSTWRHAVVADSVLVGCDLANAEFVESGWQRVEIVRSRLTGLRSPGGSWKNVTVADSMINLANLRLLDGQRLRFDGCNFSGADFGSARLTDVEFVNCDLTEADFNNVRQQRVRFRGCRLVRLAGVAGLAGARIDRAGLLDVSESLAAALHISVVDD